MAQAIFPEKFADLERFSEKWDKPDITTRYDERLSSTFEDLQDFHGAFSPRIMEIRAYLDSKDFDEYSPADRRLGRVTFAWVCVAEAVEVFKQARVPDSKMFWETVVEPVL